MTTQVFVVGTGRSGTATLAALLDGVPGCRVAHESSPLLLDEVTAFLRGTLAHRDLVDLLRRTRQPDVIGGTTLSGEANQRLSFVLPALTEAFPGARIVWLIRDGRAAVASMHHRLWYHPREATLRPPAVRPWAENRISADQVDDLPREAWARLDRFARCCWYWSYTNRLIERVRSQLAVPVMSLRLEDLAGSVPALWSFLGLSVRPPERLPHANPASGGSPLDWRLWSRRQRRVFEQLCGPTMDRHYPGWRAGTSLSPGDEVRAFFVREAHALRTLVTVESRRLRMAGPAKPTREAAS